MREKAPNHSWWSGSFIAGVPARIMRPRLVFCTCLFALVTFGIVMIYSASSAEALKTYGDSRYFLIRQIIFAAFGTGLLVLFSYWPAWKTITDGRALYIGLGAILLLLIGVTLMGVASRGAQRWIDVGGLFQFQPSEFLKPFVILAGAKLLHETFPARAVPKANLVALLLLLAAAIVLVLVQPDYGTTAIMLFTLFAMAFTSDMPVHYLVIVIVVLVVAGGALALAAPYRIARILVSLDPWRDEYGSGYQAVVAIMAFASGGLFGRGVGGSTMKYSFLPEAHNDYILAIIGEEIGLFGLIILFAVFAGLVISGFYVAARAQNKRDRLIATGASTLLATQFFVNALGIIGALPMTGKPLPFISYGGSSIVTCLLLAGLVIRVSIEAGHAARSERRSQSFAVYDESTAGEVHARSERRSAASSGFSVVDGAASRQASGPGRAEADRTAYRADRGGTGADTAHVPRNDRGPASAGASHTSRTGRVDSSSSSARTPRPLTPVNARTHRERDL